MVNPCKSYLVMAERDGLKMVWFLCFFMFLLFCRVSFAIVLEREMSWPIVRWCNSCPPSQTMRRILAKVSSEICSQKAAQAISRPRLGWCFGWFRSSFWDWDLSWAKWGCIKWLVQLSVSHSRKPEGVGSFGGCEGATWCRQCFSAQHHVMWLPGDSATYPGAHPLCRCRGKSI